MSAWLIVLFAWLALSAMFAVAWALAVGGPLIDRAAAVIDPETASAADDSFAAHCGHPSVDMHEWSPFSQSDQDWLDTSGIGT